MSWRTADGVALSKSNPHPNTHTHANTNGHPLALRNPNADSNPHCDTNGYSHADADRHSYDYTDGNTDAYGNTNMHRVVNAGAADRRAGSSRQGCGAPALCRILGRQYRRIEQ